MTKDSAQKYKEALVKEVLAQIEGHPKTHLQQAMLARDTNNRLKETKQRLTKAKAETERVRAELYEAKHENQQLTHEFAKTQSGSRRPTIYLASAGRK